MRSKSGVGGVMLGRLVVLVGILLCSVVVHAEEPIELIRMRQSFELKVESAIQPIKDQYQRKLSKLADRLMRQGDISGALAVNKEGERVHTLLSAIKFERDNLLAGKNVKQDVAKKPKQDKIILSPDMAALTGTLRVDNGVIAFWNSLESSATWRLDRIVPGKYEIFLEYAADPSSGGSYALNIGGEKIKGTVPATGDWGNYTRKTLGVIDIKKAGVAVELIGTSKHGLALMNVKSMVLDPVETLTQTTIHK